MMLIGDEERIGNAEMLTGNAEMLIGKAAMLSGLRADWLAACVVAGTAATFVPEEQPVWVSTIRAAKAPA
jgi:hypothetical protein